MTTDRPEPTATEMSAMYLLDQTFGYLSAAALAAVAVLGVADHLAGGPRTAAELAGATGTHEPFLYRVLRLVASRGVLREDGDGRFHLTDLGYALRSDAVPSARAAVAAISTHALWRPAGRLVTALREGRPTFEDIFGTSFFAHLADDPREGEVFHHGMANLSEFAGRFDVDRYDFPPTGTVVDVGGGQGGVLVDALRAYPGLRGVLFDQEHVLAGHRLGELDDNDRWSLATGDFFTEVPAGDVYVLKYILHDWSDAECVRILSNCRRAMTPDGRVLVVESLIPPGNEPHVGKALDIVMLVSFTGRERGEAEFAGLFEAAELRLNRVIPTGLTLSILEGVAR